jgi:hypothetical protein
MVPWTTERKRRQLTRAEYIAGAFALACLLIAAAIYLS